MGCKSTAHETSLCPRAKRNAKTKIQTEPTKARREASSSKYAKDPKLSKETKMIRHSSIIPFTSKDDPASTSHDPRSVKNNKKHRALTGGSLVIDIRLDDIHLPKAPTKVDPKGKGKGIALPSESTSVVSDSDSSSSEDLASASPGSLSEESEDEPEEIFTPFLSKKQRLRERLSRGRGPLSKNHH